jgi:hypothetical protein
VLNYQAVTDEPEGCLSVGGRSIWQVTDLALYNALVSAIADTIFYAAE